MSRAKCEICNIDSNNGNISFKKSIESQTMNIKTNQGKFESKRMGLTGIANIQLNGDFNIDSIYIDQSND